MINVIIADDVKILRDGIKAIIGQCNEINVVSCTGNGKEAVELCIKHVPDLVLMDIRMPEIDGIEATKMIKENNSKVKVLILTTFYEEHEISKALANGADGYILKDLESDELISAIKSTVKGLNIIHKNVFKIVREQYSTKFNVQSNLSGKEYLKMRLTEREFELIKLIVEGKKNKEIAKLLFITEGSVKNLSSKILKKLDLEDRTQLAVYAVKNGLL